MIKPDCPTTQNRSLPRQLFGWFCIFLSCGYLLPGALASDVVVAIDTSGSMTWRRDGKGTPETDDNPVRIDVVRDALLKYIRKLPDETLLHVITFDTGIKQT